MPEGQKTEKGKKSRRKSKVRTAGKRRKEEAGKDREKNMHQI
jgi:hypothetical protein